MKLKNVFSILFLVTFLAQIFKTCQLFKNSMVKKNYMNSILNSIIFKGNFYVCSW